MHKFSVSKNIIFLNNDRRKEVATRKVAAHLYQTLIFKELRISVEHDKVVATLNIIKH
jgi:hypothetical protein